MSKDCLISKGQFINGQWILSKGEPLLSVNPANGTTLWQGNNATEEDIRRALMAAQRAGKSWALTDFKERCQWVENFAKQVERKARELAELISLETGKPLWESKTEVSSVISKVKISIQAYQERTAEKQNIQPDLTSSLRYKPHGVVVVLGAFNFPAHLSNGHIIPALLAGNTILYKPSELTPAVAELIMHCWQDSALPAGVINCLQGGVACGKALLTQDIQGVYFTGSYSTGVKINQHFASRPDIILALEMGGNNPLVIGEIDNCEAAVYQTLLSTFISAGQRCTCARRLIIPSTKAGDKFISMLIAASQKLKIGAFTDSPEPFMGPVIGYSQAQQHLADQEKLIDHGGNSLLTMNLLKENTGFLSPGILDMSRAKHPEDKEIFAPLVQVYRYSDFEEAISLANQTRFGLAAGLLSNKSQQYEQFFSSVRSGLINWNRPTTGASSQLPFGGVGLSGNHRPSAYFAADYCAYPIASQEQSQLQLPEQLLPGIEV